MRFQGLSHLGGSPFSTSTSAEAVAAEGPVEAAPAVVPASAAAAAAAAASSRAVARARSSAASASASNSAASEGMVSDAITPAGMVPLRLPDRAPSGAAWPSFLAPLEVRCAVMEAPELASAAAAAAAAAGSAKGEDRLGLPACGSSCGGDGSGCCMRFASPLCCCCLGSAVAVRSVMLAAAVGKGPAAAEAACPALSPLPAPPLLAPPEDCAAPISRATNACAQRRNGKGAAVKGRIARPAKAISTPGHTPANAATPTNKCRFFTGMRTRRPSRSGPHTPPQPAAPLRPTHPQRDVLVHLLAPLQDERHVLDQHHVHHLCRGNSRSRYGMCWQWVPGSRRSNPQHPHGYSLQEHLLGQH